MKGAQYKFPQADEEHATLAFNSLPYMGLYIVNFSEQGCFSGRTALPARTEIQKIQVHTNRELVMTFEGTVAGNKFCRLPYALTPEPGATYQLQLGTYTETQNSGLKELVLGNKKYCSISAIKTAKSGIQSIEQLKSLELKQSGIACIKFREVQQ